MERLEDAIDAAYDAHIATIYKVLADSMLVARGHAVEIDASVERFKRGLEFASEVRARARVAAGLAG